ncbi:MAG: bacteriocin [Clostridia bacterium]|nr:bacteriocin [Clostridia bacterium]
MDKEKMNSRELTEKELKQVSGGLNDLGKSDDDGETYICPFCDSPKSSTSFKGTRIFSDEFPGYIILGACKCRATIIRDYNDFSIHFVKGNSNIKVNPQEVVKEAAL